MQNNVPKDQTPVEMYRNDIEKAAQDDDFGQLYNIWQAIGEPSITDSIIDNGKQKISLLSLMNKYDSQQCLEGFYLITDNDLIIGDINTDVDIKGKTDIFELENVCTNAILIHDNIALRKFVSNAKYEKHVDLILWIMKMIEIASFCGNEVSKNIIFSLYSLMTLLNR